MMLVYTQIIPPVTWTVFVQKHDEKLVLLSHDTNFLGMFESGDISSDIPVISTSFYAPLNILNYDSSLSSW